MAPSSSQADERVIRAVNYRLKNTEVVQLPKILGRITSQLVTCKCDLNTSNEATWLKTRIGSLLQDRSAEGVFCGVILAKTLLHLGGSAFVVAEKERIATWTRSLIAILKKPSGPAVKTCTIATLVKIFMSTWDHATLVREITTPTLPTFITTCLQLTTQAQSDLLGIVLESFAQLISRHPTVFRSYAAQIRALAISTLCNDPFNTAAPAVVGSETKDAACQILVLLHQCAQKGGGAVEWEKGIDEVISTMHTTLDQCFRAVTEDWQSVAGVRSTLSASKELPDEPHLAADAQTGFPGWSGMQSGIQRVEALLSLLQAYLCIPTAVSIKLPIGRIVDLLTRMLYVQAPLTKDAMGTRYNPQIRREERDELLALLPSIHASTTDVIIVLIDRLGSLATPICAHFLDLLVWLFQAEGYDFDVRTGTYECLTKILAISGPSLSKGTVKSLGRVIQACCKDLLPSKHVATTSSEEITTQITNGSKSSKAIASSHSPSTTNTATFPGLHTAAHRLLPVLYTKLPSELIPKATRTEMDRTSILTRHVDALAASVLSPAPAKASLLPFLSALAPEHNVTEAILRPRMPVIVTGKGKDGRTNEEEDDEELEDGDDAQDEPVMEMEDAAVFEPKVIDWAAVPAAKKEQAGSSMSFGEMATAQVSQVQDQSVANKRGVEEDGQPNATDSKRLRVDYEDEAVPVRTGPLNPVDEPQDRREPESIVTVGESDDEDGSDFEIPALVMRTDFEDEEDE